MLSIRTQKFKSSAGPVILPAAVINSKAESQRANLCYHGGNPKEVPTVKREDIWKWYLVNPLSGCWEWQRYWSHGYARFVEKHGQSPISASRVALELTGS